MYKSAPLGNNVRLSSAFPLVTHSTLLVDILLHKDLLHNTLPLNILVHKDLLHNTLPVDILVHKGLYCNLQLFLHSNSRYNFRELDCTHNPTRADYSYEFVPVHMDDMYYPNN
jgi:hypothetical protein